MIKLKTFVKIETNRLSIGGFEKLTGVFHSKLTKSYTPSTVKT